MADPPVTTAQLGLLRRGVVGSGPAAARADGRALRRFTSEAVDELHWAARPLFGVSLRVPPDHPLRHVLDVLGIALLFAVARLAYARLA